MYMDTIVSLPDEYREYAENAYPSNHTFQLRKGLLVPKRELAKRHYKIRKLYPKSLTSLLDVSSSKGFFVFDAAQQASCTRALGIDIHDYDIVFCNMLKNFTPSQRANFARLTLRELAERIDDFGGPFQTILLINSYQYFYFGSDISSTCYHNHDEIFSDLRRVCNGRVIFNNRVNLEDCQNSKQVHEAPHKAEHYSRIEIFTTASKYFNLTEHGRIGKYPLWAMDVK
jgi:hypothetical protein